VTLTTAQLTQMRATHAGLMGDTCQIGTYSAGTPDSHGRIRGSYSYATAIACGFEWKGQSEAHTAVMTQLDADALLRVPASTTIEQRQRVKLTYRYGTDITDLTFEVVGFGQRGPTATLVYLKQVTT
jgi:hypothetical protein